MGIFSGELIFGGAYYWNEFCVSKWVGLDNKNSSKHKDNSLKQLASTVHGLIHEGLSLGGLIFGGAYYQNFTVFPLIQWNRDITMYQGTSQITSLYQGTVIYESPR